MKGSYFLGNKTFEVREMTFLPLQENQVMIKVMAAGVCGTDVHIYHGEAGSADVNPPIVLGHEFSGIITEIGKKVTTVKIGDLVTVDPNMYCGKCMYCKMGKKQSCTSLEAIGVTTDGGFAEFCVAPEGQVYKVAEGIDFDTAAMAEPLACAIHGIDRAEIKQGQQVLIIGGGTIGLIMAQLAKLAGAGTVIISEPVAGRRKIGLELGADHVIDPINTDLLKEYKSFTGRDGADVVIECVGNPFTVKQALTIVDKCGTVVLFGVPQVDATVDLPLFDMFIKELKIVGSFINPDTHQRAVNMLSSQRIRIKELCTHSYSIDSLEEAIHKQMSVDSIKVMIHPNN